MKVLLTGHKGFIGKNIYKELINNNDTIFTLEKENVEYYLNNINDLKTLIGNSDIILHVGAISDTSLQDYNTMLYYNYHFTKILIDISKSLDKKIIYSSSASVYGNGGVNDVPNNIYAWSKLLGEEYGRLIYPEGFTSLRYFNVYGPHENHKNKMSSIVYQAWEHLNSTTSNFKLFPKKPKRDFVYVKDVVSANLSAIKRSCGIYDVGTGTPRPFEDILKNMNTPFEYTEENKIPDWYQYLTQANTHKFIPNWQPKYTLEEGIKEYLVYLKENKNVTQYQS